MIEFKLNEKPVSVDVPEDMPLLWVVRDVLGMTGTKFGCGIGQCGACTVHVDGQPRRSCLTRVADIAGGRITTIEGIGATPAGKAVQDAWLNLEVVQCGFCQSGQIMTAVALINSLPHPTDNDIDAGMTGNICRCGTYLRIREAIKAAAGSLPRK
jgi:isoquinoline 1-oxidoreductase alpha subunit